MGPKLTVIWWLNFDGSMEARLPLGLSLRMLGREERHCLKHQQQIIALFDELREPLYRYLLRLGLRAEDCDEVIQETFLRLFEHLRSGGAEENLRGWVFKVSHNLAIDEYRTLRTHGQDATAIARHDLDVPGKAVPSPEELLLRRERTSRLQQALSALTPVQKQCLNLRAAGFRYREIGEMVGLRKSAVAEHLQRSIDRLTKALS